ncbi:hypothetical protein LTR37_011785 [Vermiconidia calcicola]|uniref:Uncharacterized protein n=1 Tax=Vermiconidia calcicola TaxID=1690605 RepID=A0ACC3N132_9PEZI|nr:hypothetical protein LTR37_011785 [Vermiconidia calcicola]
MSQQHDPFETRRNTSSMTDEYEQPTVAPADENGNEVPREQPTHDDSEVPLQQPTSMEIKFTDTNQNAVTFKLKSTTKLKKAMDAYSAKVERDRRSMRFLFEGERVLDQHTPDNLQLQDGDTIEVHTEQIGGGWMGE